MRISVVIPVLNDAQLLDDCLRTLEAQTRAADEIIVVDNGSTDDSVGVALSHGATVLHEPRPGITAASSRGFDHAVGDIIARCDADCRLPVDWLERIERCMNENSDAIAVTGPAWFYDIGRVREVFARVFYIEAYFVSMRVALGHNVLFGSNCAVRASEWRGISASVPRDDSEIHDDIDFSYRVHPASTILYDRDLVVEISGRPFRSSAAMWRRFARAHHTLGLHWPEQSPPRRWRRRLIARTSRPDPLSSQPSS